MICTWADTIWHPHRQFAPPRWRRPRHVAVPTLLDAGTPLWAIRAIIRAMRRPHTYWVTTAEPGRLAAALRGLPVEAYTWYGVQVSTQADADARVPALLSLSPRRLWVLADPLRDRVSLGPWLDQLGWVVIGGGISPPACDIRWIDDLRREAQAAGVPVWIERLGRHAYLTDVSREEQGQWPARVWWDWVSGPMRMVRPRGTRTTWDDPLDWPLRLRVRERPERPDAVWAGPEPAPEAQSGLFWV